MAEPNSLDELEVELNQVSNKLPWYRTKAFKIGLIVAGIIAVVLLVLFNQQVSDLFNLLRLKAARYAKTISLNFSNVSPGPGFIVEDGKLKLAPPESVPPKRHTMIIYDPNLYNGTDILYFAGQGIDIINWTTNLGGKMTPYRTDDTSADGTYYLSQTQKDLINDLYTQASERIMWLGISLWHVDDFFPAQKWNPYTETAKAVKAFTDYFAEAGLTNAKVGIWTGISNDDTTQTTRYGFYADEPIGWLHYPPPNWIPPSAGHAWDWHDQYAGAINSRQAVETASKANGTWDQVIWLITGMNDSRRYNENYTDTTCHDGGALVRRDALGTACDYQLPNESNSYWAHHTSPPDEKGDVREISIDTPIHLVYHHNKMLDLTWQNKWWNPPACGTGCKSLAWSDQPDPDNPAFDLVTGNVGNRKLTAIGKLVFGIQ